MRSKKHGSLLIFGAILARRVLPSSGMIVNFPSSSLTPEASNIGFTNVAEWFEWSMDADESRNRVARVKLSMMDDAGHQIKATGQGGAGPSCSPVHGFSA